MEHVVFSPGPDGTPGFHRFSSLEEAVGYVEHLRNVEGVEDVSVHALTPVPVAFRAYYKVEVPAMGFAPAVEPSVEAPVDPAAAAPAMPEQPMPEQPMPEQSMPDPADDMVAAANGKRSLGFFAH